MSIEAMKQALEALEDYENQTWEETKESITSLRQAIAELESQEPVAWMHKRSGRLIGHKPYGSIDEWNSLYTTPQQRTWVGLTDEDKQIAFDDTQEGGGFWEFADAIEAKLKEKNNDVF